MKAFSTLFIAIAITTAGSAAATGSISLNQFNSGVLPVLVQVNDHGKVTRLSPATELEPRYRRLLRKNIQELVKGPAMNRQKAVSSQFVMNVTLKTAARDDGSYDAQFAYVSARPLPAGALHWVHIDGHRLALARDNDMFRRQSRPFNGRQERYTSPRTYNRPATTPPHTPPAQNASGAAPQQPSGH